MKCRCFRVSSYEFVPAPVRKRIYGMNALRLHRQSKLGCAVWIRDTGMWIKVLRVMELVSVRNCTCPALWEVGCIRLREHIHSTAISLPHVRHKTDSVPRDHGVLTDKTGVTHRSANTVLRWASIASHCVFEGKSLPQPGVKIASVKSLRRFTHLDKIRHVANFLIYPSARVCELMLRPQRPNRDDRSTNESPVDQRAALLDALS